MRLNYFVLLMLVSGFVTQQVILQSKEHKFAKVTHC